MKGISILGSTGSIGTQTLEVLRSQSGSEQGNARKEPEIEVSPKAGLRLGAGKSKNVKRASKGRTGIALLSGDPKRHGRTVGMCDDTGSQSGRHCRRGDDWDSSDDSGD